jgi:hypothetical protein
MWLTFMPALRCCSASRFWCFKVYKPLEHNWHLNLQVGIMATLRHPNLIAFYGAIVPSSQQAGVLGAAGGAPQVLEPGRLGIVMVSP